MKPKGDVYIGTSSWHYGHWKGPFYPECLPRSEMFSHYSRRFRTVKINNSFCMYDLVGRRSPKRVTADFIYIRLHGPGEVYEGKYDTSGAAGRERPVRSKKKHKCTPQRTRRSQRV